MKKIFITLTIIFITIFSDNYSNATVGILPQFDLSVRNVHTNPAIRPDGQDQDSLLDFSVYCIWTNSGVSDPFNYLGSQLTMFYNTGIVNGPIIDTVTTFLTKTGSDLPPHLQNPTFTTKPISGGIYLLRASFQNAENVYNYIISTIFPGTKIISLRFRTVNRIFNFQPINFHFKVGASPNTLLSYFDPDGIHVGFTDTTLWTRTYPENFVLPVELSSFTSTSNRNNVSLNWTTSRETNNQGFDVERKFVSSSNWTKAGYVSGNGNTTETKNYTFTERANTGKYNYRLKQIDFNGNTEYFNLSNEIEVGIPTAYSISQNYPNPFNPSTKIDFEIPYDGKVSVLLYDISGREVAKLVNEVKSAGYYTITFNASNLSSGMYFYRITADKFVETKKMALIK